MPSLGDEYETPANACRVPLLSEQWTSTRGCLHSCRVPLLCEPWSSTNEQ
jgi:hypothetical protein